jgi:surface antigen
MRTFRWNALIKGAGAFVLCILLPALTSLKAEDRALSPVAPVFKTVTPEAAIGLAKGPFAELKTSLDRSDREVALRALQMALSELGDGSTLVWRRQASQLAGRIKPVSVFRDAQGRLCRTVLYSLSRRGKENEIKGVACRSADGRWKVTG